VKKKKLRKGSLEQKPRHSGVLRALACLGIGLCLVVLCSCLSFDIGDWPSGFVYPHNTKAANWCGSFGAFCAYYLLYYIGPGVFLLLAGVICFLIAKAALRPTGQLAFRAVGLLLVTVAASTSFYHVWPDRYFAFPIGSGGVIGVGVAKLLVGSFASLGTLILILAVWAVGLLLLADTFILALLGVLVLGIRKAAGAVLPTLSASRWKSEVLGKLRQKFAGRPKPMVVRSEATRRPEVEIPKRPEVSPARRPATEQVKQAAPLPSKRPPIRPSYDDYVLPPLELLAEQEYGFSQVQEKVVKAKASALEKLLSEFGINARVVAADTGPVVTMFELELAPGVKVSQISALSNDMARALGVGAVRVVAPLPGKHTIGIEVPNSEKEKVRMKSMMELAGSAPARMQIPLFLGKDSAGEALVSDLTTMPHLLIAGTTGSGKSICINSIIVGILLTKRPDEVKTILIDPKMVEMTAFNTIPHLMCPIVTETQIAVQILEWATVKMDERYALLAEARVKNIAEFNRLGAEEILARFSPTSEEEEEKIPKKLPYIVIVIDELADLMMTAPKEIEAYIVRLAQKSRAVGIHIVLATQRPQATVVTGLIKSNMPTRIGFRVAARMDSRIILDQNGAETLLGEGDMLFLKPGTSDLVRAQGTLVDETEIRRVVKHLKEIAEPQFHPELTQLKKFDTAEMRRDELFDDAVRMVLDTQRGSVSLLQRRLNIGYARASRIIEMMAAAGVLGEYKGSQAREVMMTLEEYEKIREQMEAEDAVEEQELAEGGGSPEPAYVSEGQRGYIATDNEAD
jgi:S-DNA-T family DNA segregation ATPase FtsK/SpoIIIE